MIASNVTQENLEFAARKVGVRLNELRKDGRGFRFTIRPLSDNYRKIGMHAQAFGKNPRKINAVCWHGHRDFLAELFTIVPDAKVRTGIAKYYGRAGFLANFPDTGARNIGFQFYPVAFEDSCYCGDAIRDKEIEFSAVAAISNDAPSSPAVESKPTNTVDQIIKFEAGESTEEDSIVMFQELINSGQAWKLQGSYGRQAMAMIESGLCMLGEEPQRDYWGNRIPSRYEVQPGTKGSKEFVEARLKERNGE